MGQLPVLEIDGEIICQSFTIARLLARRYGLAGKGDVEQAKVDMIVEGVGDVMNSWVEHIQWCWFVVISHIAVIFALELLLLFCGPDADAILSIAIVVLAISFCCFCCWPTLATWLHDLNDCYFFKWISKTFQIKALFFCSFLSEIIGFHFEKDETKKAEKKKEFDEDWLPKFIKYFEELLKKSKGDFMVDSGVTYADLIIADLFGPLGFVNR